MMVLKGLKRRDVAEGVNILHYSLTPTAILKMARFLVGRPEWDDWTMLFGGDVWTPIDG